MLRKVFLIVTVVHCFGASKNAETNSEEDSIISTSPATPEIKERFFGLDDVFSTILKGPSYNPGLGFGGNQLNTPYLNQQYPQQSNWQNMQTPQLQYLNTGQDFSQQANFAQYPSQNGYGVWNGQSQNSMIQQGSWQNVPRQQQYPNKGQNFGQQANFDQYSSQNAYGVWNGQNQNSVIQQGNSQNVQTPQQGQNFNQQYPLHNQENFNSGNSQYAQVQDDWSNAEAPQQFPSIQDFSQQYNSDQSQGNFGLGANQNFNTGTINNVPSQNGFQNQNMQNNSGNLGNQNFNTGTINNIPSQNGFQDQNLEDDGGNPAAILENPVPVVLGSEPDRIVFQDDSDTPKQIQCVQDCRTTTEYRPICGSNNMTYFNLDRLKCARNCGIHVFPDRPGRCF